VLPYGVRRPLPCVALGVLSIYLPHSLPIGFTKSSGEPVDLTHSVYGRETLSAAGMPCSGLIDT